MPTAASYANLGQTVMQIMCRNIVGCGLQGLQSDNENQPSRTRQSSNTARDTANLQSRFRQ
ncbi:hypothetical protein [Nostoc sp.]|uniref:hypothetical protein n=1 Tax=Nostoc sp. TaxID=1180 RepID=UPI002FFA87D1